MSATRNDGDLPADTLRICTGCGEPKPLAEYYFYSRSGKPYSKCKPCSKSMTYASRAKLDPGVEAAKRKDRYDADRERFVEEARVRREAKRAANPKPPRPVDDGTKKCTKCHQVKDKTEYYVKSTESGRLFSWCKACHCGITSARLNRLYAEDPEPFKQKAKDYLAANGDEIRKRRRENRLANLESERAKERKRHNTPSNLARRAAYRVANADQIRASRIEYYRNNKPLLYEKYTEYRLQHPEVYRAATRKWTAANPEKARVHAQTARQNRRARMKNAEGSYTADEWQAIKERQDFTCLMCGFREPFIKLSVDHIIPISKGGSNYASNLAAVCTWCNSVKKDRVIDYKTYFKTRPEPRHKPFSRPRKRPGDIA